MPATVAHASRCHGLGTIAGEWRDVDASAVSTSSALAWAYLVVAGSLVGFTAFAWLLRHAPISQVVTHQYVNPLVAVALGARVPARSQRAGPPSR